MIASQCEKEGLLTDLESVAHSLYEVLTDPRIGNFEAPTDVTSLLVGKEVTKSDIDKAISEAAVRAGATDAVLLLAFIGHGAASGFASHLGFAASDSDLALPTTLVSVNEWLTKVAMTPGIQEVIALVDTCRAGGAIPNFQEINASERQGGVNISLLTPASAHEDTHGLRFTRNLTSILKSGIRGTEPYISVDAAFEEMEKTQPVADYPLRFKGNRFSSFSWLAHNVLYESTVGPALGRVGEIELRSALSPLGKEDAVAKISKITELDKLRQELLKLASDVVHVADLQGAIRVIDGLRQAHRTKELLDSWPGQLTSDRLMRAARLANSKTLQEVESSGSHFARECVEALRLRSPRIQCSPTVPLATFIALLAAEDGLDANTPEIKNWAKTLGATTELNDALAKLAEQKQESRLRLIISLHAAVADEWPEKLCAWLIDSGEKVASEEFPCAPNQRAIEERFGPILKWANKQARHLGTRVRRIEIAAPAPILASWHPEEAHVIEYLGVSHDVVLRWSGRISPLEHLGPVNDIARMQLQKMQKDSASGAPVAWLGTKDTHESEKLIARLKSGSFKPALALDHLPTGLESLLEQLLIHRPIVLWTKHGTLPQETCKTVEEHWDRLPGELSVAYRHHWRHMAEEADAASNDEATLAHLRTVWDDMEWLDFCEWFETDSEEAV
ncbi:hypothetical protein [Streptomyces sp. NRRL S-1868]|uniref:vWA-MoxR associated conflict system protein n=1 Tax=Streptomyces sp. NRRL S-1868 TaxID=1463892 RepID=UPI000A67FC83|nr:hypothetical protein [Streptomyces sp. NRRL S-1868]